MFSQKRIDEEKIGNTAKSIKSNKSIQFKKTKMVYTYDKNGALKEGDKVLCCQLI